MTGSSPTAWKSSTALEGHLYEPFSLGTESAAAYILQLFSEITQEVQLETLQLLSMYFRKDHEKEEDGLITLHVCEYMWHYKIIFRLLHIFLGVWCIPAKET